MSKLLIAFMDTDRKHISYKGMQNSFTISTLECSHLMLLGNKMESEELELIFEGTHEDIMKLVKRLQIDGSYSIIIIDEAFLGKSAHVIV